MKNVKACFGTVFEICFLFKKPKRIRIKLITHLLLYFFVF